MIPRVFTRHVARCSAPFGRWSSQRSRCVVSDAGRGPHTPAGSMQVRPPHSRGLRVAALAAGALATGVSAAEPRVSATSPLRLVSGVYYRPDPEKKNKAGEDASFVSPDGLAVGVADGVGGWADSGVDAGVYARLLMSQAEKALGEGPDNVKALLGPELAQQAPEPLRVLLLAHSRTPVQGSSTACIVLLRDSDLHVANLGDSGLALLRGGQLLFKSPPQQHQFNFPYQIGAYRGGDSPLDAQLYKAAVQAGDVLVVATDGLWDNVFPEEVTSIVTGELAAGRGPGAAAKALVDLAHTRGHSKTARTPFSVEAMRARVVFMGGKLDDTTVIVSVVEKAPAEAPATPPR
jgi:protein phosphatase PTC7